jgi:hypothetical protein
VIERAVVSLDDTWASPLPAVLMLPRGNIITGSDATDWPLVIGPEEPPDAQPAEEPEQVRIVSADTVNEHENTDPRDED